MKKYMVMICGDGEQSCFFYDNFVKAEQARMDAAVSMGYIAQVYELMTEDPITGEVISPCYFMIYE